MFEALIERLILRFFGNYIENLDKNKLSVGIISGKLTLEDILLKSKTINDMKLPFKLIFGRIGRLHIKIPWKSNFSAPTLIEIDTVQVVLSLIPQEGWEFLDFISYDVKLNYLNSFLRTKLAELAEAFVEEEKSSGYFDRVQIKILDNLHINFSNIHLRIEDCSRKPFYSLGCTLEEILVVNTNEQWEENFIDRNIEKDINVFKLLKIQNFGFYLQTGESFFISSLTGENEYKRGMNELFLKGKDSSMIEYLIKPISVMGKMMQTNKIISSDVNTVSEVTMVVPKFQIWINLQKFEIDFRKSQFDTIVRILNHVSTYQRYQYFKHESRKYFFYRPECSIKENPKQWWRYAITTVIKQRKFLQGNSLEFILNPVICDNYKSKFHTILTHYLCSEFNTDDFTYEESKDLKRIITVIDINHLYEWAIDIVQTYFTNTKREENKQKRRGFFSKIFGTNKSIPDELLLTKEEEEKIEEVMENVKKEVKHEIISTGKEIKLQVEFILNEGSFLFSNAKKNSVESFGFRYKNLSITFKNCEAFNEIEAFLLDFNVDMVTSYNKDTVKTIQVTIQDENRNSYLQDMLSTLTPSENLRLGNYVWKLKFRLNGPGEEINSKLDLHVNYLNLVYHQAFLERVISFFMVETQLDEELANKAWEKLSEIKEKTSQSLKIAMEKRNIVQIEIEPRKVIIPLNKYDFKRSKLLVLELGKVQMTNTSPVENYNEQYILDFSTLSILYLPSIADVNDAKKRFELVSDMRLQLIMGLLSNSTLKEQFPMVKFNLLIESVVLNLSESVYYTLHFIIDVMKPTKKNDYWALIEQSKQEIKKNCKAFSKVSKRNNLIFGHFFTDYLAVLSGGYIYFYKTVDDDDFTSCFYIKDAIINEKQTIIDDKAVYEINVYNKYGNIELQFSNEAKCKQFLKALRARINEMNIGYEVLTPDDTQNKFLQSEVTDGKAYNNNKTTKPEEISAKQINPYERTVGVEIKINELTANFLDEKTNYEKLYTLQLSSFNFGLSLREYDVELGISLFSIKLLDESYKDDPSFYELITSHDADNSSCKLFNITILVTEAASPMYTNSEIYINVEIGYLYSVWQPYSMRRILMFVAHNDILRNKIKDEILGVPAQGALENETGYIDMDNTRITEFNPNDPKQPVVVPTARQLVLLDEIQRIPCTSQPNHFWVTVDVSLQKVSMIWVQPVISVYFMQLSLGESKLKVSMTQDHFTLKGQLGNVKMIDLTNYPHTIKSQEEFINMKGKFTPTEILGFEDSSSLTLDYCSKTIFCPLVKDHYTSECKVNLNSVKFTYIQEHFFRVFNYLLQEFLGSLSPPEEIKEYKNKLNKIPTVKTINETEFMNLEVTFQNPQVILKARPYFDEGFLADLGTVTITNSYQRVKGKIRKEPEIEKYLSVFKFDLLKLYLVAKNKSREFKIIEETNACVEMRFTSLTDEENNLPDEEVDKSFQISFVVLECIKLNLRQSDFTSLMRCSDLNLLYQDGQNLFYNYEKFYKLNKKSSGRPSFSNENNSNSTPSHVLLLSKSNNLNTEEEFQLSQNCSVESERIYKIGHYLYMSFDLKIPSISLSLYENINSGVFCELILSKMEMMFLKKINGPSEVYLTIKSSEAYNYINLFSKELMMTVNEYNLRGQKEKDSNTNTNSDDMIQSPLKRLSSNIIPCQFDIKLVMDPDGEKNMIVKINNIKLILRQDILQLLKIFFLEGFPIYQENTPDLPNQYDPDTDNRPGFRMNIDIKNPLISLLTQTMTCHEQDVICLSTDLFLLYKKEKIMKCKNELMNSYKTMKSKIAEGNLDPEQVALLEKEINKDFKEIYIINMGMYEISPFVCNLTDIFSQKNFIPDSRRKIMNNFSFVYESRTVLRLSEPDNYVIFSSSSISVEEITCKLSYRDLVLFLKVMEYNMSLMDTEYEVKYRSFSLAGRGVNDHGSSVSRKSEAGYERRTTKSVITTQQDVASSGAIDLTPASTAVKSSVIDKGMWLLEFESKAIQIILIDDHSSTYYPFLSIITQDFRFTYEQLNYEQSQMNGNTLVKIVTYNYYVGVWEPLLEKTNMEFSLTTNNSDPSVAYRSVNVIVSEPENKNQPANINISDITLTFLYSTLNLWIEKYFKLKSNYQEEAKKLIQDSNMKVTNHTVVNLTGRNLIIHRVINQKEKINKTDTSSSDIPEPKYKKLPIIEPNGTFDIEYLEDDKEEIASRNKDISLKLVKDNYICFEFTGIDQSKISENILKIDHAQSKIHKVNYVDIAKKYKSNVDLKELEFIVTEVRIHDLRKFVYFYSPLVFKNKLQWNLTIDLKRKELTQKFTLEPKKSFGIPYEYMDGAIEFFLIENDRNSFSSITYDLKSFLSPNFTCTEVKMKGIYLHFITNPSDNRKKCFTTVAVCTSYIIRNCLPFAIDVVIDGKDYHIPKSEKEHIVNLSQKDNLSFSHFKCLQYESWKKEIITLFNPREYQCSDKQGIQRGQSSSSGSSDIAGSESMQGNAYYSTSFVVYDSKGNQLRLLASLVDSSDSKTMVIHASIVIINQTMANLKFYYEAKSSKNEISGQMTDKSSKGNVLLASDGRHLVVEILDIDSTVINTGGSEIISGPVPLNAIGMSTSIECRSNKDRKPSTQFLYEFTMETHLSLVAKDLEIYTTIITMHPKYIICNKSTLPIYICLSNSFDNLTVPEIINPYQSKPFYFFGMGIDSSIIMRPIEEEKQYRSGSKWNWTFPINLNQMGVITIQIPGINPLEKKYINLEKKLHDYSTFVILSEANYFNSQFVIENYSRNISVRLFQICCENGVEYADIKSKNIYAWSNSNGEKILKLQFLIGDLKNRPALSCLSRDSERQYEIHDDKLICLSDDIHDGSNTKHYPWSEVLKIMKDRHSGYYIRVEISTDGMKKTIKIIDDVSENNKTSSDSGMIAGPLNAKSILPTHDITGKVSQVFVTDYNVKIDKLGISLISDNRNTKGKRMSYSRNEIFYATFKGITFFYRTVTSNINQGKNCEVQCKINSLQIDNEYNYITQYPVILRPQDVGDQQNFDTTPLPPFFNVAAAFYRTGDNPLEPTKFQYFNYLIQSFVFSIDSEIIEALLNLIANITIQLKTTFTEVHPILVTQEEINMNMITNSLSDEPIREDYYEPIWLFSQKIPSDYSKVFIQTLETSSIDMIISLNAHNTNKVFEKYITSNPLLSSILSTVSNIDKANIQLNGSEMNNLYSSAYDLFMLILSQYKQATISQFLTIFGAIDVIGNPSNLLKSLGTGVKDFFHKPIQGVVRGPLEGVKGAWDGSVSLIKHTIGGTFSATSKIASGLSKGLLYLSQDEQYMNDFERKKITKKPKNFVEGIGFGITSVFEGVWSGAKDVVAKPVEGGQKSGIGGIGSGILKGFGGLVSKPFVGLLQLVSNTSEGIKNTITSEESLIKQERKPRPFYGKHKYIKSYNLFHADVLDILKNKIEPFKKMKFEFYGAEFYQNHKDEPLLLVFDTKCMHLVDLTRKDLKVTLAFSNIKEVKLENDDLIRIFFVKELLGKSSALIYFSKNKNYAPMIFASIQQALEDNSEHINI